MNLRPALLPATAQWAANWRRAQFALYNVQLAYFTGSHSVTASNPPFITAGTKGYIWGHDGRCTGGEWILPAAAALLLGGLGGGALWLRRRMPEA